MSGNFASYMHSLKRLVVSRILPLPTQQQEPLAIHHYPEPSVVLGNKLLAGKNVLITGAGKNIGRSIALEMAKQGANIFFTDIIKERCAALEEELRQYGVSAEYFVSDISRIEDSDSLSDLLEKKNAPIDILVNNVGIQIETVGIQNFDSAAWDNLFRTNVFGPMHLTKHISQKMISTATHGCILFITSVHQSIPFRFASYSSSKAALEMIVKELAIDLSAYCIRVNAIAPGWVAEDERGIPFPYRYSLLHQSSINPSYIGRAAVFLSSNYFSKFTTGITLTIDAGLSLYNHRVDETL